MLQTTRAPQAAPTVTFVGTYPPRRCGIATFTQDIVEASSRLRPLGDGDSISVVAMVDGRDGRDYPDRVVLKVDADDPSAYVRAADHINARSDVVCLQHEYGIFGGPWGRHVLRLVEHLDKPLVVTCHTVSPSPESGEREVLAALAARADRLVVMSREALDAIVTVYGADPDRVHYIPHGIHDMPFRDPPRCKRIFGVTGHVLLTFGLLHSNKGIEYTIDALPAILRRHPDTHYVVAGKTHPTVVSRDGESYRESLVERARLRGVADRVLFVDRFLDLGELRRMLVEADVFVAPYLNLDQATSGALAYALGAGKAVIATPFPYAREMLGGGRGRLVPPAKSLALAREVVDLFDRPEATAAMRRRAYRYTRGMVWTEVARRYHGLFADVSAGRTVAPVRIAPAPSVARATGLARAPLPGSVSS